MKFLYYALCTVPALLLWKYLYLASHGGFAEGLLAGLDLTLMPEFICFFSFVLVLWGAFLIFSSNGGNRVVRCLATGVAMVPAMVVAQLGWIAN